MPKGRKNVLDLTGRRFGRLVALERASSVTSHSQKTYTRWHCSCDCGKHVIVWTKNLRSDANNTRSCGCLHRDSNIITGKANKIHGHSTLNGCATRKTRTYYSWRAMLQRCHDPKDSHFFRYGARGIIVCDEWRNDFTAFLADMGERPEGMTLDRIGNSNGYNKSNCRWATAKQQIRNSSHIVYKDLDDKPITIDEIAETLAMTNMAVRYHFKLSGVGRAAR